MRRSLYALIAATLCLAPTLVLAAPAEDRTAQEEAEDRRMARDRQFENTLAPLPMQKNVGPCPTVKVLYDAARYIEFKGGQEQASQVAYSGEIENLSATCSYLGAQPITVKMELLLSLGKGPQGAANSKTYSYWVAVTDHDRMVIAKQYFTVQAVFPRGSDRVTARQTISEISIPRATVSLAGDNFEVLVGFDVTPQMAAFNREGKRFQIEAGAPPAKQ